MESIETTDNADEPTDEEVHRLLFSADADGDYYALLGLSREANPTTAQIRAAYHRSSLAFHPDRQPEHARHAAEEHFTRLQRAYETLINPQKRVIYDLEGEEGVRNEYRLGGAMRSSTNEERTLGFKTMSPDEFRRYYVGILRARERKALEELVEAGGQVQLKIDAYKLVDGSATAIQLEDGRLAQVPRLTINHFNLSQSFHVPLPELPRLLSGELDIASLITGIEDTMSDKRKSSAPTSIPTLTFSGGLETDVDELAKTYFDDKGRRLEDAEMRWFAPGANGQLMLATRLEHVFTGTNDEEQQTSGLAKTLAGTTFSASTTILPRCCFLLGLGREFRPFRSQRPFDGALKATFNRSLSYSPPSIEIGIERAITDNSSFYTVWGSGDLAWPKALSTFLPVKQSSLPLETMPSVQIGCKGRLYPDKSSFQAEDAGSWHVATTALSNTAVLQVQYSCSLFTTTKRQRTKSRISADGNAVPISSDSPDFSSPGVRLEMRAEASLQLSLAGTISALRPVGSFTVISCGIGLSPSMGLFLALTWRRLGQEIAVPVLLVPAAEVTSSAFVWALSIPCMVYMIAEFGIIRPLTRMKRNRMIEKKRKELSALIEAKRSRALSAQELMTTMVAHKRNQEGDDGLLIISALYGAPIKPVRSLSSHKAVEFIPDQSADVTIAVQAMVNDGQVYIPRAIHKGHLTGFWDPAPLTKKVLLVRYLWRGAMHMAVVKEQEGLKIPMRSHTEGSV